MPPKRSAPTSASTTVAKKAKAAPAKKAAPAESEVKASTTTGRVTRGSTRKTAEELMEAPKEAVVEEKKAENVEEAPKPKKAKAKAATTVKESSVKPATPAKAEKAEKPAPASKKAEPKEKEEEKKNKKEKPASKAKGKKKEPTPEPAPAADEAMDEDNESFIGAFSDADDGADSSDDESDAEDAAVKAAGAKVEVSTLPHARDDKTVAARLKKASKKKGVERATLYLGRIPHGFYEEQMKEYFGQFGDVTRLRLARNPKVSDGRPKTHRRRRRNGRGRREGRRNNLEQEEEGRDREARFLRRSRGADIADWRVPTLRLPRVLVRASGRDRRGHDAQLPPDGPPAAVPAHPQG